MDAEKTTSSESGKVYEQTTGTKRKNEEENCYDDNAGKKKIKAAAMEDDNKPDEVCGDEEKSILRHQEQTVIRDMDSRNSVDTSTNCVFSGKETDLPDSNKQETSPGLDPLSYTKAEEFTSEIYKIQIHNLPKFGFNQLKKRLKTSLGLNPHKIKSPDKHFVTYVCFRNETDRQEALLKINGHVWKGKTLEAKIAAPVADPYLQKKRQEGLTQNIVPQVKEMAQRAADVSSLSPEEAEARLRASVVPLWDTDYEEQLKIKTEKMQGVLRSVTRDHFLKDMFKDRSQNDGMACKLLTIMRSPVLSEYRNKNEFTVGYGLDGQTVKVGFRYGLYKDGTTAVGDCRNLGIAMPAAIPVIESFEEFVSNSKWAPFLQQTGSGHWQTLTVRTFRTGDVMAMADFVPRKLDQSEVEAAKSSLKDFYTTGPGQHVNIKSFYFRIIGGKGRDSGKDTQLLFGEEHVYESLLNLRFRISPEAFFQVNTAATEGLYQLIADWCQVTSTVTVLDVCCGTGTIGLSMANRAEHVVGIEMCKQAVDDARENAVLNGITNVTFHCSKVEDIISKITWSIVSSSGSRDMVAVVDPPRAGLHKNVIKTLRKCSEIRRLVYVSCNPESARENFIDLIRPATGKHRGTPFTMEKAKPVDLFPGTRHCELVLLFTRLPDDLDDGHSSVPGDSGHCSDHVGTGNNSLDNLETSSPFTENPDGVCESNTEIVRKGEN